MSLSFHLWHHHPCPVPHLFEKNATAWQSAQKCVFRFLLRSWASPFIWNPGKKRHGWKGEVTLGLQKKLGSNHSFFHVSINYLWISKGMQACQASTSKQYWILTYIMVMMQIQWPNSRTLYTKLHKHRKHKGPTDLPPHVSIHRGFPILKLLKAHWIGREHITGTPQKNDG